MAGGPLPKSRGKCEVHSDTKKSFCNVKIVGAQHFAKASIAADAFNSSVDYASHMDGDGHGRISLNISGLHGYFELELNSFDPKSQHVPKEVALNFTLSQIQVVAAQCANSSSSPHELQVSYTYSTSMDVVSSPSSFLMDVVVNNILDFEIFPGFDDYFMPLQPPLTVDYDYEEVVDYDRVDSPDPSFLWNF
ncbi:hypothetical protein L1987_64542 [Smallanthus sonchifolius]|uniref:Uncharacterized protein n=1 Tax=Smallanthus sonchifolius TaxID=185202 RepID=A0ACB9BS01_9ASTR|nr:hypothetical protein L1987_64542 [Smallanthus sonchifolius]